MATLLNRGVADFAVSLTFTTYGLIPYSSGEKTKTFKKTALEFYAK